MRSVAFLGHIVSSEGVEVYSRNTEVVKNCPETVNPTDIQSFQGLAGYCKRFVHVLLSIASPLAALTKKKSKFEWSEPCEESFQLLKDRITFALVLTLLEGTDGFVVYCVAFLVGLGCVLMLHRKVIVYAYRQLKPYKKNYQLINLNLQS